MRKRGSYEVERPQSGSIREEALALGCLREFNPCPEREPFSLTIHDMQLLVERMRLVLDGLYEGSRAYKRGDGELDRLRWRIDWTLTTLGEAARDLRSRGYGKAGEYLERHAGLLVSFAELAVVGVEVPYTTNRVERLMGEVAKRCKNRWMHWGTDGLRSILIFVLVKYTCEEVYERFKNAYIHHEAFLC